MSLSDFYPEMKGWTPAPPKVEMQPQIPNAETTVAPYLRTTLPLPLQYSPDTLRQYNRPGLSSFRISPLPPSGNPAINAAAASTTTTSIHEFVSVAATGPNSAIQFNNGGALGGVSQFEWDNVNSTLLITGGATISGTVLANLFDATTGFRIGGLAASGKYLRGNGTNFVSATLSGSDILAGIVGVTYGGTGANLSATGGTSQVVQQTSVGGVFTVGQLTFPDISGILGITKGGTGTATPALVQGNDITITGSWPNNIISVKVQSGVTAGVYTNTNLTVDAQGIITAVASGSAGFTNPMTTLGDIIYENAVPAAARLAGNTTSTKNFLVQTGTGAVSAAPTWGTIVAADVPNLPASIITSGQLALARGGTNADLSATGGTSQVLRQSSVGAAVTVSQLSYSDISGTLSLASGSINLTAQTANHAAATIFAVVSAGTYLITVYLVVSQAATTSSTLPDSRLIYTDNESAATITVPVTSSLTTNTTSTFAQASFIVNAKASTNIQYDIGQVNAYASVGGTPMQFAYHARAVFLG